MSLSKKVWTEIKNINVNDSFLLGPLYTEALLRDPKHLGFTLSRYKFAAKMTSRCEHIVDIGCGEGIGELVLLTNTLANITAIDFDEDQIRYANQNITPHAKGKVNFICQDLVSKPYEGKKADGLVCIDVIEHIHENEEEQFFKNCADILNNKGIAIFGTPNKYATQYASKRSKEGHINLFDPDRLTSTLEKYFTHTFLFSMNDEVVHTGYNKMAHYLIALCIK